MRKALCLALLLISSLELHSTQAQERPVGTSPSWIPVPQLYLVDPRQQLQDALDQCLPLYLCDFFLDDRDGSKKSACLSHLREVGPTDSDLRGCLLS